MGKLLHFRGVTRLDLDPKQMLEGILASAPALEAIVVLGFEKETGDLFFASSRSDGGDVMWMMEIAKSRLIHMAEVDE